MACLLDFLPIFSSMCRRSQHQSGRPATKPMLTIMMAVVDKNRSQQGMTLFAVMAIMAVFAIALLAVAPSVQQEIRRQKEIEAIARGEEVAEAIRQYVEFYRGSKLPNSMDDLL